MLYYGKGTLAKQNLSKDSARFVKGVILMNLNRWKAKIFAAAAVLTAAVLVLTGSISFPTAAPLEVSAASGVSTSLTDAQLQAYADQVAAIVNQEREKVGKKPLYVLPRLNGAASVRAEECVESFSHTRPNGSSFSSILTSGTYAVNWTAVGENIAWGQRTPAAVMDAWMNSAGHKANILSEKYEFDYIGVGVARDSSGVLYWTQNFIRCSESFSDAYLPTYQEETTTTTQITTTTSTTTTTEATVPATTTKTEEPTETWHWIHLSNLNLEAGDTVTVLLSESGANDDFTAVWYLDDSSSSDGFYEGTFSGDQHSFSITVQKSVDDIDIAVYSIPDVWCSTYLISRQQHETTTTPTTTTTETTTTTTTTTTTIPISSTAPVTTTDPGPRPTLKCFPIDDLNAKAGDTITITLREDGFYDDMDLIWFFNDSMTSDGADYDLQFDGDSYILEITPDEDVDKLKLYVNSLCDVSLVQYSITHRMQTATTVTTSATQTTTTTRTTTTEATESAGICGDINLDGKVNLTDAVLLNKTVAGAVILSEQAQRNADCFRDGECSGMDAIALIQFLTHIIDAIPVKEV